MEDLATKLIAIYGDTQNVPQTKSDVLITNVRKVELTDLCVEPSKRTRIIALDELMAVYIADYESKTIQFHGNGIRLCNASSVSYVNGSNEYQVGFEARFTAIVRVAA